MRGYIDHVLAILPFEPDALRRLDGPPCTFVGHPLTEQLGSLRPNPVEQSRRDEAPPILLVLPGSRRSEIGHHMAVFGETLGQLQALGVAFEAVLPTMPHLEAAIARGLESWSVRPRVVVGEEAKRAAFRVAHAAFAKSGTVTLELALAQVPMVTAYRAGAVEAWIVRRRITSSSVILANLVIGENVIPEFIQEECTTLELTPALRDVLTDTPMRRRQQVAFARIDDIMSTGALSPSERAADVVIGLLR
jgi:lipid-A-disaccharide synthase